MHDEASHCPVATFIRVRLAELNLRQYNVAERAGLDKPNIVSMLKTGQTKLPVAKIGAMAIALKVEARKLFRLCMRNYYTETWAAIEQSYIQALDRVKADAYLSELGDAGNSPSVSWLTQPFE